MTALADLGDGKLLSYAGNELRVWDVATGACLTGDKYACSRTTTMRSLGGGQFVLGQAGGSVLLSVWDGRAIRMDGTPLLPKVTAGGPKRGVSAMATGRGKNGETLLLAATKAGGLRMLSVWEDTAGQRQALEGSINSRFDIDALLVIDA